MLVAMAWHPRPLLIVDEKQDTYAVVRSALERIGGWLPLLPISQAAGVRQYLRDAAKVGVPPIAVIVRLPEDSDSMHTLVDWIVTQPEPICSLQLVVIADSVVNLYQETLDMWIEDAVRAALGAARTATPEDRSHTAVMPDEDGLQR